MVSDKSMKKLSDSVYDILGIRISDENLMMCLVRHILTSITSEDVSELHRYDAEGFNRELAKTSATKILKEYSAEKYAEVARDFYLQWKPKLKDTETKQRSKTQVHLFTETAFEDDSMDLDSIVKVPSRSELLANIGEVENKSGISVGTIDTHNSVAPYTPTIKNEVSSEERISFDIQQRMQDANPEVFDGSRFTDDSNSVPTNISCDIDLD